MDRFEVAISEGQMSVHDFEVSGELERAGVPFLACVMAAKRRADTDNLARLRRAFPEIYSELEQRYGAPGGLLRSEREWEAFERPR